VKGSVSSVEGVEGMLVGTGWEVVGMRTAVVVEDGGATVELAPGPDVVVVGSVDVVVDDKGLVVVVVGLDVGVGWVVVEGVVVVDVVVSLLYSSALARSWLITSQTTASIRAVAKDIARTRRTGVGMVFSYRGLDGSGTS
jgi:hypothetical protein